MKPKNPCRVPRKMRDRYDAITDKFCREHLDEEYADLARQMTAALARKRPYTASARAKRIRDLLGISILDPRWTLPSKMDSNPMPGTLW